MQISVCFARALGALALALTTVSSAAGADIPDHGAPIVLFNGHDLNNFDIFLKSHGLNNDPDQVFRVERGIIHISGKEFGYIITKQEFANYYLRAEFKWGEGTYAPRQGKARDSGILYNVRGPQKVWPTSIEFQILEGGTGDFWLTDGAALTANGTRTTGPEGKAAKIDRIGKGPSQNVAGYRDRRCLGRLCDTWSFRHARLDTPARFLVRARHVRRLGATDCGEDDPSPARLFLCAFR